MTEPKKRERGRGAPTKFRPEYVGEMRRLCEAGFLDVQIARYFGVSRSTIDNWQTRWPEMFEARTRKHDLKPPGRRRLFRPEYCVQVRELAKQGIAFTRMATVLGVSPTTFDRWRREYPEFGAAVQRPARIKGAT